MADKQTKTERLIRVRFKVKESAAKYLVAQLEKNAAVSDLVARGWRQLKTKEKLALVLNDTTLTAEAKLKAVQEMLALKR